MISSATAIVLNFCNESASCREQSFLEEVAIKTDGKKTT